MGKLNLPAVQVANARTLAIGRRIGKRADRFDVMLWRTDARYYEDFEGWRQELVALDPDIHGRAEIFRAACQPLKAIDPGLSGPQAREIGKALGTIGNKIRPDMEPDAARNWTVAMVIALSDMPPVIAEEACAAAMHVPIRFVGDVETVIREQARLTLFDYERVDARLRKLLGGPAWPRLLPSMPPVAKKDLG